MYDYGLSTLEQYSLTLLSTSRIRGALLCRTEEGIFILKEFRGTEKKLQKQQELLENLGRSGCRVDEYFPNKEGNLVSRDKDGVPYTLQYWYEGKECDTRSEEDILRSIRTLAQMHKYMKIPLVQDYMEESLEEIYQRHNQELRKIRKFIRKKGASCLFEKIYLATVEDYLEKGEAALELLRKSAYSELREEVKENGWVCHGEYNQHNVLLTKKEISVTSFEHWGFDVQMADLYRFMRKILEKYNWDVCLGMKMLRAYHQKKRITLQEWQNLKIRFLYPEKYWKLANYYYSHNKAWISEKNTQKLEKLTAQKEVWENFERKCFGNYPFDRLEQ
ncbi:MAG: CotS family spore coat protein [Eubacteriales bacterium]|nr:CotS family spore coat protein [Eubacteriales bacterium]